MRPLLICLFLAACPAPGPADRGGTAGGGGSAGGSVTPAFEPHARFASLDAGQSVDLGAFTCSDNGEGADTCRRVTDYSGFVYDSRNHQLLMFGGGHSTTMTDS